MPRRYLLYTFFTSIALLGGSQALAIDINVNVKGAIQIPPCQINGGRVIEVDFGDISVVSLSDARNHRKVTVPVICNYVQGDAYVKLTGTQLGDNQNVLATNLKDFGIALYQGEGVTTKLNLGEGKSNGQNTIGFPLTQGLIGDTFTFTAVPFQNGTNALTAGAFYASANMSISYF
ncbi:fimbrial protein [Escherichia coli]|uniref:fimbrial protein n=1 Tax=Escherichia coli TaxID=562 RepID=UPI0021D0DA49|nr:fimbrial protein [Escherichia coli]MCU6345185.1 fimbrial protein [Escherichia coli]